jgi:hypothetical protein
MATFAYTRVEETMLRTAYPAWLTALTSVANTTIIFYEEQPTVEPQLYIRVKVVLQVES